MKKFSATPVNLAISCNIYNPLILNTDLANKTPNYVAIPPILLAMKHIKLFSLPTSCNILQHSKTTYKDMITNYLDYYTITLLSYYYITQVIDYQVLQEMARFSPISPKKPLNKKYYN